MPDLLTAPIFTAEDVRELAAWLLDTMIEGSPAPLVGAGRRAAEKYASTRAGQLLGMRLDRTTGVYVRAARASYRIGEDLRDKVRDAITESLKSGDSMGTLNSLLEPIFGEIAGRSSMIARTEPAMALNAGGLASYAEMGVELVDVVDGPGCLPDDHVDGAPEPDPEVIGVQYDRQAHGQTWTVDDAAELLISHPHCGRLFTPSIRSAA